LKQPLAGTVATLVLCAVALGFISLFPFPLFSGWVAYLIDCIIPMQVIIGVIWGGKHPAFAANRTQPIKGVLLLLVNLAVGAVLAVGLWQWIGHGIDPPTPILIFYMISLVLSTFVLSIMWGGWPFVGWFKSPVAAGFAVLLAAVGINYLLFRVLFDFSFMQGAPFHRPGIDPHGLFNAWNAVVYYVTLIAAMFLIAGFDLWPLTKFPALMRQPVLGLAWTGLSAALAGIVFYLGIGVLNMDIANFMITVPIPFIFGTIVVLNMLQGSLYGTLKQPGKGVATAATVALVGSVLAQVYGALSPMVTGTLKPGLPAYDFEIWLASALLSVTFPALVFYAEFFKLWPLRKAE
jgi:hypothetical protein